MKDRHDLPEKADIVVVGGGITGISAALHAATTGASVLLLEEARIGWGASGRNGGSIVVGIKGGPAAARAAFGDIRGEALTAFAEAGPSRLYDKINRLGIECDLVRSGHITGCHLPSAVDRLSHMAADWASRGAPVRMLSESDAKAKIGSQLYCGALIDERCGNLNPLKLIYGLASAALAGGSVIREHTSVVGLSQAVGGIDVRTTEGTIRADKVLLALDAYADRPFPTLADGMLTPYSCIVATEPVPPEVLATILPDGQAAADSRRVLNYFRRTPDGRIMLGGRGPMADPTANGDYRAAERALVKVFPQLAGSLIAYRWSGRIAIAMDQYPHLTEPMPGVIALNGYAGRGVALGSQLGEYAIDLMTGKVDVELRLLTPLKTFPMRALRGIYMAVADRAFRFLDLWS